jgi:hypothetical protein
MATPQLPVLDVRQAEETAPRPTGRLVVLVPRQSFDETALIQSVERLGIGTDRTVVLLGLADVPEDEARLHRRIDDIARALGGGKDLQVGIVRGMGLSAAIDNVRRDGDIILFPYLDGSQRPPEPAAWATPARLRNRSATGAAGRRSLMDLAGLLLDWIAPLLIIIGFFLVQVRIEQGLSGAAGDALLVLSVLVEIAALWRWEQWSSGRLRS